jgi:hypothetical protein
MRRRTIEVKIILFDIFSVIALVSGKTEITLLKNGVLAVPESQGETEPLAGITDAEDAILSPAVGARS